MRLWSTSPVLAVALTAMVAGTAQAEPQVFTPTNDPAVRFVSSTTMNVAAGQEIVARYKVLGGASPGLFTMRVHGTELPATRYSGAVWSTERPQIEVSAPARSFGAYSTSVGYPAACARNGTPIDDNYMHHRVAIAAGSEADMLVRATVPAGIKGTAAGIVVETSPLVLLDAEATDRTWWSGLGPVRFSTVVEARRTAGFVEGVELRVHRRADGRLLVIGGLQGRGRGRPVEIVSLSGSWRDPQSGTETLPEALTPVGRRLPRAGTWRFSAVTRVRTTAGGEFRAVVRVARGHVLLARTPAWKRRGAGASCAVPVPR